MSVTFFETNHCRALVHCGTCRNKEGGRGFRESIAKKYGGEVDFECPYGGEWGKVPEKDPSLLKKIKSATKSTVKWVAAGAPKVSYEVFQDRLTICKTCPFWEGEAYSGVGKCTKCGCSGVKLKLATEKCPIDNW